MKYNKMKKKNRTYQKGKQKKSEFIKSKNEIKESLKQYFFLTFCTNSHILLSYA